MSTTTAPLATRLEIKRTINASPERVFALWTEAEKFTQWFGGNDFVLKRMTGAIRAGERLVIEGSNGPCGEINLEISYREIKPTSRLVFGWRTTTPPMDTEGDTTVTVNFRPVGDKTEIHLIHEGFATEKGCEAHKDGWNHVIDRQMKVLGC